jgi:hypothetical protein
MEEEQPIKKADWLLFFHINQVKDQVKNQVINQILFRK